MEAQRYAMILPTIDGSSLCGLVASTNVLARRTWFTKHFREWRFNLEERKKKVKKKLNKKFTFTSSHATCTQRLSMKNQLVVCVV
jgi:hypothetical protein